MARPISGSPTLPSPLAIRNDSPVPVKAAPSSAAPLLAPNAASDLSGVVPVSLRSRASAMSNDKCRAAILQLNDALGKASDLAGVKKALANALGQLQGNDRQDAIAALKALSTNAGSRIDYTALVDALVPTHHHDCVRSDLLQSAAFIGRALAPKEEELASYKQALQDIHSRTVAALQQHATELQAYEDADHTQWRSLMTTLAAMPDGVACDELRFLGANDQAHAQQWLAKLRAPDAFDTTEKSVRAALRTRLVDTQNLAAHTAEAPAEHPPSLHEAREAVVVALTQCPGLAPEILGSLGLGELLTECAEFPPQGDAPEHLSTEAREFWNAARQVDKYALLHSLKLVGEQIAAHAALGLVPGASTAATLGAVASDIHDAFQAAQKARIFASTGLSTFARAEAIDDAVAQTEALAVACALLSAIGVYVKPLTAAKVIAGARGQLPTFERLLRFAASTAPASVPAIGGAIGAAFDHDTREAWDRGDYSRVAQALATNALVGGVIGAVSSRAMKASKRFFGTVRAQRERGSDTIELKGAAEATPTNAILPAKGQGPTHSAGTEATHKKVNVRPIAGFAPTDAKPKHLRDIESSAVKAATKTQGDKLLGRAAPQLHPLTPPVRGRSLHKR